MKFGLMNYRGLAKGKTIELEEALPFPEGQAVWVSVEKGGTVSPPGSPEAILQAVRDGPHLGARVVQELQAAIQSSRLPVGASLNFNDGQ